MEGEGAREGGAGACTAESRSGMGAGIVSKGDDILPTARARGRSLQELRQPVLSRAPRPGQRERKALYCVLEADLERAATALVGKKVREAREEERPTHTAPRIPFEDPKTQLAAAAASACSGCPAPGQSRDD